MTDSKPQKLQQFLTSSQPSTHGFEYRVWVSPHHTDYGGIVWHGTYLTWMEEARVEALRSAGIEYHDLVNQGCELPVVELSIRYHQPVKMGMQIRVKTRMMPVKGVRLQWNYEIESLDSQNRYVTAQVTLVPIDRQTGKVLRRFPPQLQNVLSRLGNPS